VSARWWRYYALYLALVAPFLTVDILVIQPVSLIASWVLLAVMIFVGMTVARRLERRWWPHG
jgi:hypothetical protein